MAQEIRSEEIVLNENEIVCLLSNKIVKVSGKLFQLVIYNRALYRQHILLSGMARFVGVEHCDETLFYRRIERIFHKVFTVFQSDSLNHLFYGHTIVSYGFYQTHDIFIVW